MCKAAKIILLIFIGILFGLWPYSANAAKYEYDALNRLSRVVYENGMQIAYNYDEVGNRIRRVSTLQADSSIDGTVNFQDFAILASHWLDEECDYPDEWCEGADINWSTEVGIDDLAILAQQWLENVSP